MTCNCKSDFRFTYESLDLLALNERDFSLASSASIHGAVYAFDKTHKDLRLLEAELKATSEDNTFLEHIVAQLRGSTSRGWARNGFDK